MCPRPPRVAGGAAAPSGIGIPGGLPAPGRFLPKSPGIAARRIIRTAQEAAVLAHPGLEPAAALGTRLDGVAAVAATKAAVCLDDQALAAIRARVLPVFAVEIVRAAVEEAAALPVFAAGEPSLDASWTGDVVSRRPTENGHVVPVPGQFQSERGRRSVLDKQEDVAPGGP